VRLIALEKELAAPAVDSFRILLSSSCLIPRYQKRNGTNFGNELELDYYNGSLSSRT